MTKKEKTYHFIYKITNLINEKYYIGMHSTDNLNDGYFGSGKYLRSSLKKYGKENFNVEILEFLNDRTELKKREREIVTSDIINEELCMNLKPGGEGGGGFYSKEHELKFHKAGGKAVRQLLGQRHVEKMKNDPEYRLRCIENMKGKQIWLGKRHKEESKKKIGQSNSITQKGEKNSQFGTCWITNGINNKKIKKDICSEYTINGWYKGRTIKYRSN